MENKFLCKNFFFFFGYKIFFYKVVFGGKEVFQSENEAEKPYDNSKETSKYSFKNVNCFQKVGGKKFFLVKNFFFFQTGDYKIIVSINSEDVPKIEPTISVTAGAPTEISLKRVKKKI